MIMPKLPLLMRNLPNSRLLVRSLSPPNLHVPVGNLPNPHLPVRSLPNPHQQVGSLSPPHLPVRSLSNPHQQVGSLSPPHLPVRSLPNPHPQVGNLSPPHLPVGNLPNPHPQVGNLSPPHLPVGNLPNPHLPVGNLSNGHLVTRVERIQKALNSKLFKSYVLFLNYTVPMLDTLNMYLQSEAPLIHVMRRKLHSLYEDILLKFVKPQVLCSASEMLEVDYRDPKNHKDSKNILIGNETKTYIENNLNSVEQQEIIGHAVDYYMAICDYMLKKLPMRDVILKHAEVLDLTLRHGVGLESVMYFVNRFPVLCLSSEIDQLQIEFAKYQVYNFPNTILDLPRVDDQWSRVSNIKDPSGKMIFSVLGKVMLGILVIPHSNCDCERIFSLVSKNLTRFRASLGPKTLESLLVLKSSSDVYGRAHEVELADNLLKKCKTATVIALSDQ